MRKQYGRPSNTLKYNYNVSHEYIDSLCEWLIEWAKLKDSWAMPQFFEKYNLGYPYFYYCCRVSDKAANTFEVAKCILHNKWLDLARKSKTLPAHQAKVLMRFLRYYDSHALDVEKQMKQSLVETQVRAQMEVTAENYARAELEEPYRKLYEQNLDKRGDREEA